MLVAFEFCWLGFTNFFPTFSGTFGAVFEVGEFFLADSATYTFVSVTFFLLWYWAIVRRVFDQKNKVFAIFRAIFYLLFLLFFQILHEPLTCVTNLSFVSFTFFCTTLGRGAPQ